MIVVLVCSKTTNWIVAIRASVDSLLCRNQHITATHPTPCWSRTYLELVLVVATICFCKWTSVFLLQQPLRRDSSTNHALDSKYHHFTILDCHFGSPAWSFPLYCYGKQYRTLECIFSTTAKNVMRSRSLYTSKISIMLIQKRSFAFLASLCSLQYTRIEGEASRGSLLDTVLLYSYP